MSATECLLLRNFPSVYEPTLHDEIVKIESFYGTWPSAGSMPDAKALELLEASIAAFRAARALGE